MRDRHIYFYDTFGFIQLILHPIITYYFFEARGKNRRHFLRSFIKEFEVGEYDGTTARGMCVDNINLIFIATFEDYS